MDLSQAIRTRRSIRKYEDKEISKELLLQLINAAILAPSASNSQPWAFAIIQDSSSLKDFSDRSKTYFLNMMENREDPHGYKKKLANPDFNIFFNAGTLIIIYATVDSPFAVGDCCLAAQNLMLTAHDLGLGSCWIGFSQPFFDSTDFKKEMGIPANYRVAAPIIIGYPKVTPSPKTRNEPEIIIWKTTDS